MSTVKPPLTLPLMRPVMVSLFSIASSSSSHTMARLAFSRDRTVSPKPFSRESSATFTSSPTPTSISPASLRNCSMGTIPSDFRPALTTTTSERTSTTMPVTMAPGLSLASLASLCSNSSAKLSVMGWFPVERTDRRSDPPRWRCARHLGLDDPAWRRRLLPRRKAGAVRGKRRAVRLSRRGADPAAGRAPDRPRGRSERRWCLSRLRRRQA